MELVVEKYKQTEIGWIPEDWNILSLFDICTKIQDGTHFSPKVGGNDYLYITSKNIRFGFLDLSSAEKIDAEQHQNIYKRCDVKYGDLLLTKDGANTGNVAMNTLNEEFSLLSSVAFLRFPESNHDANYFLQQILSFSGQSRIKEAMSGNAITRLTLEKIRKLTIPLPPNKTEQTAIATVLSDADVLISNLEKLLTKKRNIKQGAMQKLLQPKEGWENKFLPDVCWFQEGPGVRNSQFTTSGVKLFNGTNIEDGKLLLEKTVRYISEKEAYGWYSHFLVDDGDILIACSGVTIDKFQEKVTVASQIHLPLCMNTSTMRFKTTSNTLSKDFFFHFLKSKSFKEQIGGKATGSAQLNFGPSHVKMVEISLPSLVEQIRIAAILSDMDTEIAALETKLEKYRNIKLGMMQNLLTGKIRLI